jgi:hypothetical protein
MCIFSLGKPHLEIMKFIISLIRMLHNINFVKITIVQPKNIELNALYFWNNYIICTIILDPKCSKGGHYSVLSPLNMFFLHGSNKQNSSILSSLISIVIFWKTSILMV